MKKRDEFICRPLKHTNMDITYLYIHIYRILLIHTLRETHSLIGILVHIRCPRFLCNWLTHRSSGYSAAQSQSLCCLFHYSLSYYARDRASECRLVVRLFANPITSTECSQIILTFGGNVVHQIHSHTHTNSYATHSLKKNRIHNPNTRTCLAYRRCEST